MRMDLHERTGHKCRVFSILFLHLKLQLRKIPVIVLSTGTESFCGLAFGMLAL